MAKEKPGRKGLSVSLGPRAWKIVSEIREVTGVPQTESLARILEWYCSFGREFRTAVLQRDPEYRTDLVRLAMQKMLDDPSHDTDDGISNLAAAPIAEPNNPPALQDAGGKSSGRRGRQAK